MVKNVPAKCRRQEIASMPGSGRSPGGGKATHSSILAWKIPWTEEPGVNYSPWGCNKLNTTEHTSMKKKIPMK